MKLNEILKRLPYWYASGDCFYLKSPPGRGKTTTIAAAPEIVGKATGKSIGIVIINGGLLTPMDVLGFGLPKHFEGHSEMVFSEPFFWRTDEGKRLEEYDGGIIFIDEADKMDVDVKKVIGEAALSGRLGPHRLPKGWVVWMAGNRSTDRSGSTKELDHLINRRREIDVTDDLQSWQDWAATSGVMPLTMAFAQQNPQIVWSEKAPDKQEPWCTPRSLVKADSYLQILGAADGVIPDDHITIEEISGGIGQGGAAQYFAFVRLEREMPKFERIIADPKKAKLPEKPDAQMLICFNLAHRVAKENIGEVITYIDRMPKEFAVTFAHAACRRDYTLVNEKPMQAWATQNSALMAAIAR